MDTERASTSWSTGPRAAHLLDREHDDRHGRAFASGCGCASLQRNPRARPSWLLIDRCRSCGEGGASGQRKSRGAGTASHDWFRVLTCPPVTIASATRRSRRDRTLNAPEGVRWAGGRGSGAVGRAGHPLVAKGAVPPGPRRGRMQWSAPSRARACQRGGRSPPAWPASRSAARSLSRIRSSRSDRRRHRSRGGAIAPVPAPGLWHSSRASVAAC